MGTTWDDVANDLENDSNYFKLADGDSALINFTTAPEKTTATFDDKEVTRFKAQVFLPGAGTKEWEFGKRVLKDVLAIRKRKGDLSDWLIYVSREGTGMQTRYTIQPERELSDDERSERDGNRGNDDLPF